MATVEEGYPMLVVVMRSGLFREVLGRRGDGWTMHLMSKPERTRHVAEASCQWPPLSSSALNAPFLLSAGGLSGGAQHPGNASMSLVSTLQVNAVDLLCLPPFPREQPENKRTG